MLKISKEISFPIKAVTETFAAIGRRGSGKSYLATMLAEQMLDAEAQVIVIDPVGIWWGLRVAADGKSKGKNIFVIGGEHGDVPIVPEAGKRIAQLVAEKEISAVIDVSGFWIGEHKRFSADFAEEFFHLKKTRKTPVHIFIEEAQTLIPQRVGAEEARMVGAFERIIRLGRNYGIGATLVTQRPQSVNKEVLSQVECLFVLQITGLHERKALEDWVQEKGADRELIGELPSLERGEGYVWSPAFLRIYKRVHFSKKETFNASATPEVGKEAKATRLSSIDVEKLRKDMSDVIEKAEQDDPVALKRKIVELKRGIKPQIITDTKSVEKALLEKEREFAVERRQWERLLAEQNSKFERISKILDIDVKTTIPAQVPVRFVHIPKIKQVTTTSSPLSELSELTNPEQRILNAIAWLNSIGVQEPSKTAVAFLAGYTYGSGGFNNPCGSLRTKGFIRYVSGNRIVLTDEGQELAKAPNETLTQDDLHSKVLQVLETPHQRILKPLIERYPESVSNEELANLSGYAYGTGGFNNPKGRLRTLGLIEYPEPNHCRASDILFP